VQTVRIDRSQRKYLPALPRGDLPEETLGDFRQRLAQNQETDTNARWQHVVTTLQSLVGSAKTVDWKPTLSASYRMVRGRAFIRRFYQEISL
jgi:hypothetical protein